MTKKQSIVTICIATVLMAGVTIGASFAYWRQTLVQTGTNELSTGCFNISLTDEENEINLQKTFPISDEAGRQLTPFTFKVTNTCDTASAYTLNLEMLTGTTLGTQYVDVLVNDGNIQKLNSLPVGTKNESSSVESRSIDSGVLTKDESKEFSIRLWLDKDVTLSDDTQNKVLKSKIVITSEATEIASGPKGVSFENDSWTTIQEAVQSGNYVYQVGDTKTIKLAQHTNDCDDKSGSGDSYSCISKVYPEKEWTIRVANTSTPEECSNENFSQSSCGFILEFVDIIENYTFSGADASNKYGTNVGGWKDSKMRTYLNTTFLAALPEDLQNVISPTKLVSGHGMTDTENFITTDKIFLLSGHEVYVDHSYNISEKDSAYDYARRLDYYESQESIPSNIYGGTTKKRYDGLELCWSLRTADLSFTNSYVCADSSKSWAIVNAYYPSGISPAFKIN